MKATISVILICGVPLLGLSCASSTILLKGEEGLDFIRSHDRLYPIHRFTSAQVRSVPGGELELAVLNTDEGGPQSGNFRWVRRERAAGGGVSRNSWSVLLLDSSRGVKGEPLTEKFLRELGESKLEPAVVLSPRRRMKAVVYYPAGTSLKAFLRPDEVVRLEFGRRDIGQGRIGYSLTLFESDLPEREEERPEKENRLESGDLVSWESGEEIRAGVVKEVRPDGNCVINVPTVGGSRREEIPSSRLTVITPAGKD